MLAVKNDRFQPSTMTASAFWWIWGGCVENGAIREQVAGETGVTETQSWDGVEDDLSLSAIVNHTIENTGIYLSFSSGWKDQSQDAGSFGVWWGPTSSFQMAVFFLSSHDGKLRRRLVLLDTSSSVTGEFSCHHQITSQRQCPSSDISSWRIGCSMWVSVDTSTL